MKKFFSLIIIACLFISARDKHVTSGKSLVALSVDTTVYANLQVTTTLTDMGMLGKYYDAMITASFFDNITNATVPVTNVKYNGHILYMDTLINDNYYDTSGTQPVTGMLWEVSGLGNIPSFTFQPTNRAPVYTDFILLPDTIDATTDLTLPLTGISSATHIYVTINDGGNNSLIEGINIFSPGQSRLTPNTTVGSNSITIKSADLMTLSSTSTGNLIIMVSNTDVEVISGKKVAFTNNFFYLKNNFVIQ